MSSTGQATSSNSNVKLFIDALADYAKITGIDLAGNPFAAALEQSNPLEAILQLLHDREKAFKEYRDGDRRLISCLSPAVKIIQAFSGIIGASASLIPFSPAGVLFASIDALLAAASGVTSSYDALLDLFECLGNFLKRLEIYTTIPPTPIMIDVIGKIMVELLSVLALATKQIKQGRFKKFAKKLLGDSEIEVVVQRLDRLTEDEARAGVAQTLGVVHSLVGNMKVVMEDGKAAKASTDSIRQDLVALRQVLNEMNKMKSDQLRCESCSVQYWLSPPDPSTNHKFVRKARQDGTATWFFEGSTLTEWKRQGSLLWIHGKPGAGKSTLLSAIIHDIEGMRAAGLATMAYYYFDFRDVKKQDCHGLLSSLISQLSAESDSCFQILSNLYSDHGRGTRQPDIDALKKCITNMLSLPGQAPIYIIVDAIDECPNFPGRPSAREEVLALIEELVGFNHPDVHLCVASRPETDIRAVFEPLTSLKISLHDERGQKEDIIEYIKSFVRSHRRLRIWKEEDIQFVIDTLSDKADGMFRWVVCQIDRLRNAFPASIRKLLNDLPKTLDETYSRILLCIDEEKREYAQRLLRCLTVSIRPLRVDELAEILAVQFYNAAYPTFDAAWRPENAEEAVLAACSSLITIVDRGGYQIAQFSHYSVKEYLTSERLATAEDRLSYYHILPEPAHTILAHASLSILLQLDETIDRNTIDRFPLAQYAARHWVEHAQYGDVSSHVEEVMECLFDKTKPHFAAWVWLCDVDHNWVAPMSKIRPTKPEASPLYYAALCGFSGLVRRLLDSHSPDKIGIGGSHTTRLHTFLSGFRGLVGRLVSHSPDINSRGDSHATTRSRSTQSGFRVRGLMKHRIAARSGDVNSRGGSHTTALHAASVKGHIDVASLLLENGADPNSRDHYGRTPLHGAAHCGQFAMMKSSLEIAQLLVKSGANVNVVDFALQTPLHEAARFDNRDVAELLVESGASLDARDFNRVTPLYVACRYGMLNTTHFLISRGSDVNALKYEDMTPLHGASLSGQIDIARLLLDCGSGVDVRTTTRWTPLHYASRSGHLGLARLLIDRSADVNACAADRSTPIHFASESGYLDIAKLLVEQGANVNSRSDKETPLDCAAKHGNLDIARFLIENGAAVSARDNQGWTPFHQASSSGHLHITKFLLECGVDIDVRNKTEETSLYLASSSGQLDVARFLIDRGADIHAEDHSRSNALHISSKKGHLDVVRMLINTGIAVDIRNGTQMTPLALASSAGKVKVGRFLIERGADINVRDDQGWAPLHFPSRHGHLEMARLLLDHGVDANIQRDNLSSPLHLASAYGHLEIAELLIQRGANVEISDEKGETPLYQAAENGNSAITRLMIDHGANVHSADSNGSTVLHAASQGGHLGIVKMLLRRGADVDVLNKANKTAAKLASENKKAKVAKFIAKYKADPNIRKKLCSTTLDTAEYGADEDTKYRGKATKSLNAAARKGNIGLVKSLLEQGADVNGRDANDRSPIEKAASKGNVDVLRLLIERGGKVDSCNKTGWTPLHFASLYGQLEASRVLVDHGANVNARMDGQWTPLHLSADNGHFEIVKLLLEHGPDILAQNDEGHTPYQLSLQSGIRRVSDLLREHGACGERDGAV